MGELLSTSEAVEERALLIGVQLRRHKDWEVEDSLDELAQLAHTAGAEVVGQIVCKQPMIRPGTFVGKGKLEEIAEMAESLRVTMVLFDDDLSPAQGRNIAQIIKAKIIDRTQLILDIFAQHAHTSEGSLQIELAQLQYLLPRLRRMWTHLERQKGGIGLRGPGEKQLESDRRRIQVRISRIRGLLGDVSGRRAEQRRGRRRHGWALITLVGYTNAGKSTLLNALTGADVKVYDKLFATLDPTTRQIKLPNNQPALITDTVGFIRKLPHHLVESFKATLEEVNEADLLIHVVDTAHTMVDKQIEGVHKVLEELGADRKPVLYVLNKMDREESQRQWARVEALVGTGVKISARTEQGLDDLRDELADFLKKRNVTVTLRIPMSEGKLLASVKSAGKVLHEKYEEDGTVLIEASIPGKLLGHCGAYLVESKKRRAKEAS